MPMLHYMLLSLSFPSERPRHCHNNLRPHTAVTRAIYPPHFPCATAPQTWTSVCCEGKEVTMTDQT